MLGLLLSDDLLDTSRITGFARAQGLVLRPARSVEQLRELAAKEPVTCVLIDLNHPGLDVAGLLSALRENCPHMPCVVAYGSHVDTAGLKAARQAGCDLVLPRSAFFEKLSSSQSLADWLSTSHCDTQDESAGEADQGEPS
jgi:DNA-binding NarL/FixJ family response regulator